MQLQRARATHPDVRTGRVFSKNQPGHRYIVELMYCVTCCGVRMQQMCSVPHVLMVCADHTSTSGVLACILFS